MFWVFFVLQDTTGGFHQPREVQRTCGAQRMAFRDEPTTGVHHKLAPICVVPSVNQVSGFTCRGWETQLVEIIFQYPAIITSLFSLDSFSVNKGVDAPVDTYVSHQKCCEPPTRGDSQLLLRGPCNEQSIRCQFLCLQPSEGERSEMSKHN